MISKKEALEKAINIVDTDTTMTDAKKELIERVKDLLPNIVNSDNQVDVKALTDLFDITNTTSNNQGYELTFAGKGLARAKADENTTKELKVEAKQSKDFDNTENVIIRGDNIDVLKILYKNYHSKIKMIYIDPPYNTKSENFIYNDNFKQSEAKLIEEFGLGDDTSNFLDNVYGTRSHSGWLSFMYPRLQLAKELLTDDGVIFISIDDNEQANLKIICDEIFGEENFVATVPTIMNLKGNQDAYGFAETHEYFLCYTKKKLECELNHFLIDEDELDIWKVDDYGLYKKADGLKRTGEDAPRSRRPKGWFPVFISLEKEKVYVTEDNLPLNEKDIVLYPTNEDGDEMSWSWSKEKIVKDNHNLIITKLKSGNFNIYKKQRPALGDLPTKKPKSIFYKSDYSTSTATNNLKKLLGNKVFSNSKPIPFLQDLILIGANKNDIILDFFAGSGTTAHAVMQLNAENGRNCKFILCQLGEKIDPQKFQPAIDFCKENNFDPVISSITIERVNRAGGKIQQENPDKKLDIGYKVFSLTDKPQVNYDDNQKSFKIENKRTNHLDTLINMLVSTCKTLDVKVEEIKEKAIYKADNEIYIIDKVTSKELEQFKDLKINIDSMADIDLENYLNLDISNKDNITIIY